MNTLDCFAVPAIAYLGGGLIYGQNVSNFISDKAILSFLTVSIIWVLFRSQSYMTLAARMSKGVEHRLILLTYGAMLSILLFYIAAGPTYFSLDKFSRYSVIGSIRFLRTGFWAGTMLLVVLLIEKSGRYRSDKRNLLIISFAICMIEGSRELLLIFGLQMLIYFWKFRGVLIIPSGPVGFFALIFSLVFVTVLFKPLFYFIFLGQSYSGGWLHYSELINWYRWLHYAETRQIDLSSVQRFDIQYFLDSLIMPFSRVPSSSAVWYSEVLGYASDGSSGNYGYSAVLWLSYYFQGSLIVIPWALMAFLFIKLSSSRSVIMYLFTFSLCFLSYRLFRSEWVLVAKTLIWLFFYPSVAIYLLSRARFGPVYDNSNVTVGTSH